METAIGAPGSLERFKAEHPEDWHRLLGVGTGGEALDRFVCGTNPTHHLPVWEGMPPLEDPPSRYDYAWELGQRTVEGRQEHLYATRVYRYGLPAVIEVFYDLRELPPIRYSAGEVPGSGPIA